jgi:uncharacterized membrane-anchored protein YjiN (DUF445 family)
MFLLYAVIAVFKSLSVSGRSLQIVLLPTDILHQISKQTANWIGHILRRNCLTQQVIEGKIKEEIEVTGRRG